MLPVLRRCHCSALPAAAACRRLCLPAQHAEPCMPPHSRLFSAALRPAAQRAAAWGAHRQHALPLAPRAHLLFLLACFQIIKRFFTHWQVLAELRELTDYRAKYFSDAAGGAPKILALGLSSRKNLCIHPWVSGGWGAAGWGGAAGAAALLCVPSHARLRWLAPARAALRCGGAAASAHPPTARPAHTRLAGRLQRRGRARAWTPSA